MAMMEVGQVLQHIAFRSGNGLYSETHQYDNTLTIIEQYSITERIILPVTRIFIPSHYTYAWIYYVTLFRIIGAAQKISTDCVGGLMIVIWI